MSVVETFGRQGRALARRIRITAAVVVCHQKSLDAGDSAFTFTTRPGIALAP
jgi:hypothetical protein